ncbi:hypothetical protein LTR82_006287 [Friedmanniomyces endolithicus]|uniref:F-box domain-containing protein n=1 Tax=Friedmanniomyces endolithicus TaxID=329885 RepID=A0AAN6JFU0_9PEZI|nr:hypothetical protein LTR82_006287 [Friedmanniomyces endolithicus]
MPFRLLDLPPELWSQICALALASDHPSTLYLHEDSHARTLQSLTQQPPLLRTCTALRPESVQLWYANTVFLLIEANKSSPNWRLWLESLTLHSRRYMRKIFITSTHQDLVTHVRKNDLLPRGCELTFAESLGQDSFRLCDFTYRVTLPAREEPEPGVGSVQHSRSDCGEKERVGRSSKKANSIWGRVIPSMWQTRRSGPARSR